MDANHDIRRARLEAADWSAALLGHPSTEVRVWTPKGYVSKRGGFTEKVRNAQVFSGPGVAIRYAQVLGFAILSW